MPNSTGLFLIDYPPGIDLTTLESKLGNIKEEIAFIWKSNGHSLPEADEIRKLIKEHKPEKIVLSGIRPGFHKSWFSKIVCENRECNIAIKLADLYEVTETPDVDDASMILESAFAEKVPQQTNGVSYKSDTLIIGGGIAGIQAALEIAEAGFKVHLVEKSATIGGHMAMFDKTFPTLDCAACILTPKMVEAGQHPNIDLLVYSEIENIIGDPGNFTVSVRKKAKYIDADDCIGCGMCTDVCPVKVSSEFDAGTALRKSAYIPFPQAVPNKYVIDDKSCRYILEDKCGACLKVCPKECINFDDKDEVVDYNVGNIIVATGFKLFDPSSIEEFGYGKFMNVVTALEFERLVNAAGPTSGLIRKRTTDKKGNKIFTKDGEEPKSFALVHCVGSRDRNHNKYCSKVCCMYSLKLAHLIREKVPEAEIFEYFIDMRAFGKGYEEFYDRIKNENVYMIRGRTASVEEKNGKLHVRSEDILRSQLIEQEADMVILAAGLEPALGNSDLAKMIGIEMNEDGWFKEVHSMSDPVKTIKEGITIAGLCQGPKDIPDTVAQASAAASHVIKNIIASTES